MNNKANLVLGAVRGYSFEQLRPFVISLKRTKFHGDLVLLWNNLSPETLAALRDHGVILVPFEYHARGPLNFWSHFWPIIRLVEIFPISNPRRHAIYKRILNLTFVRYVHVLDFLEDNCNRYERILLTDVRDVVFQDDPFRDPLPGEITAFLESPKMKYGAEPLYNDPWMCQNYSKMKLRQLSGQRISCCGTVMGTEKGLLEYVRAFVGEIRKLRSVAYGADTSIHNVLVRDVLRKQTALVENLQGAVATIACNASGELQLGTGGVVLDPLGRSVPVLHQYDRHPELVARISSLGLNSEAVDHECSQTKV